MMIGAMYNGTHPAVPAAGRQDAEHVAYAEKRLSSPGYGRLNESTFTDAATKDQIHMSAQRTRNEAAERNHTRMVRINDAHPSPREAGWVRSR